MLPTLFRKFAWTGQQLPLIPCPRPHTVSCVLHCHQKEQQQLLLCRNPCTPAALTRHQHRQRCSETACRAGLSPNRETACVVEYLFLLQAMPDVDPEEVEILLDSLWSLQYMIPSVMCAAAGTVISCTLHQNLQQQQQPQQPPPQWPTLNPGSNGNSNGGSERQQAPSQQPSAPQSGQQQLSDVPPVVLPPPGMFTHVVHFRLSSRLALEGFMAHPLMSAMQEQVNTLCSNSAHIVFEGLVTKRLEALFRRGEEFASGVEHVLLLQPGGNGGVGADTFLQQLGALAESSVAGGIQASHGAVVSCVHTAATHVLMTRFAAAQQVEQLLRTPACAAVVQGDPRVPVVAASSLSISIQPTEQSTRVDGNTLGSR